MRFAGGAVRSSSSREDRSLELRARVLGAGPSTAASPGLRGTTGCGANSGESVGRMAPKNTLPSRGKLRRSTRPQRPPAAPDPAAPDDLGLVRLRDLLSCFESITCSAGLGAAHDLTCCRARHCPCVCWLLLIFSWFRFVGCPPRALGHRDTGPARELSTGAAAAAGTHQDPETFCAPPLAPHLGRPAVGRGTF